MKYSKLVRDKIPEIIKVNGGNPVTHIAEPHEYREKLAEKLVEEALKFKESGELGELADILEVIDAICASQFTTVAGVRVIQKRKAIERGKFRKKIILDEA
ncbi:MAG: nucleoside triphosphate pyrophosphohydrolase [Candidatus Yanofskybacteria bacterium]|nr:nucleoside triphosphate pyrophosphohydrolase [Candidatus Yanofskybacteria bacterium]